MVVSCLLYFLNQSLWSGFSVPGLILCKVCGKEKITKNPLSFLVQGQMRLEKQKSLDKTPAASNRGHFLLSRLERFPELMEHKREGQRASAQVSISVLNESVNNRKGISTGPR